MIDSKQDKSGVLPIPGSAVVDERLPYRIELWDAADPDSIERVLARAFSAALARAIFGPRRASGPAHHAAAGQAAGSGFRGVKRELIMRRRKFLALIGAGTAAAVWP